MRSQIKGRPAHEEIPAKSEEHERGVTACGAAALIVVGTITFTLGADWSIADGFYVAVATLTTSSILNPNLRITDPWLEVFTAAYVLVGIGILVELARRIGVGFIAAREEMKQAKAAAKTERRH